MRNIYFHATSSPNCFPQIRHSYCGGLSNIGDESCNFHCVVGTVNSRYNEVLGTVVSICYKLSSILKEFITN